MTPQRGDDRRSRAEALAAEYVARLDGGGEPDLEAMAGQLPDDDSRRIFRRLVADTLQVQSLLPVQVRPGAVLSDRYRIVAEIGAGGMGKVFEAIDVQLERRVAVKVLAVFGVGAFDPERLFHKEAVLLAGMQHPNIVAVHEVARDGDVNYIAMDLVRGDPVNVVLERVRAEMERSGSRRGDLLEGALSQDAPEGSVPLLQNGSWYGTAARVMVEIARTIESAHAEGLIHRDIKPQNVMLRGDGTPVVLDFGLAGVRDREGEDITQGLFGSAAYLATEQAQSGLVGSDPRTDVYQLGTLLYEFLVLQRAFPDTSITKLLENISIGSFRRPRAVDRAVPFELEAICLRAMERDPANRYQTVKELREDLERYVTGSEVPHAARGGWLGSLARGTRYALRRHRVASLAAAALLVGLVGGLIAFGGGETDDIVPFRFRPTRIVAAEEATQAVRDGKGTYAYGDDIRSVREGDVLGLFIQAEEPLYVYVVSVYGEPDPPTWMTPMKVDPLSDDEDIEEGPEEEGWVRVPAGETRVACTIFEYDEGTPVPDFEGLWIFTSPEPQPDLVAWMTRLKRLGAQGSVPYERALAAFHEQPSLTRGRSPALTAEQKAGMRLSLDATVIFGPGEEDWPYPNLRKLERIYPVVP